MKKCIVFARLKDMLYFYAEGTAFYFEPKDLIAYDAFLVLLQSMLKS